jgi:acetyl esterase
MSIHQGIGQATDDIIKGFASFVRDVINTQSQLAA